MPPFRGTPMWPVIPLDSTYDWLPLPPVGGGDDEDAGSAIVVTVGNVHYHAHVTSTSTIVLRGDVVPTTFLRMYLTGHGVRVFSTEGDFPLTCSPNPVLPGMPESAANVSHIAYIDSKHVPGRAEGAAASLFRFYRSYASTEEQEANPMVRGTAIPHATVQRRLDGKLQYCVFKDVHVLPVKGSVWGDGWLMLAVRQTSEEKIGAGAPRMTSEEERTKVTTCIVGFWSPDPEFSTTVRGPYFLASPNITDEESGVDSVLPGWIGVPSGVVLRDQADTEWLYIYYTVEPVTEGAFRPGTHARRIRTSDLPWNHPGLRTTLDGVSASGGVPAWLAGSEQFWDTSEERGLFPGEFLGKVRFWTGVDGAAGAWGRDQDPSGAGNTLFWDLSPHAKDVDAAAVTFEHGVGLYVSLNRKPNEDTFGRSIFGIWRTTAGPAAAGRAPYMDFAFRWADVTTEDHTFDLVSRSSTDGDGAESYPMRLDPDPVQLPSGEWLVFTGGDIVVNGDDSTRSESDRLLAFSTSEANGSRRFRSVWRT